MPVIEKKTFENVPEGYYKAKLVAVNVIQTESTKYGKQTKFQWLFEVMKKQTIKGNKVVWEDVNLTGAKSVSKLTGLFYGNKAATMTSWLKSLISAPMAERFAEEKRDTDELIGWNGEISVEHTVTPENTFANVTLATPSDEWLVQYMQGTEFANPDYDPFAEDKQHEKNVDAVVNRLN
jgi:hypothetical protein